MASRSNIAFAGFVPIMTLAVLTGAETLGSSTALAEFKSLSAQCEALMDNSVRGLAIQETYSNAQLCACARTSSEMRRQVGAAGVSCPEQNRNFNPPTTASASPPEPGPGPGPGPGNPRLKGNNGWGNGGEGINAGSDKGNDPQSSTKSADAGGGGDR
jgi:hypothetical protein